MTEPPPIQVDHRCRVSVLEPERLWSLRGDTLWMTAEGQPEIAIPLSSVRMLRLEYAPTRFQTRRYHCHLYNSGTRCGTIQNEHFVSLMTFEDRSETYRALVLALVRRLAAGGSGCRFVTGTTRANWFIQIGILAVSFLGLAAVLFLMGSAIGWLVGVKLLLLACLVPTAISWVRKNRPGRFSADDVPEALLPRSS